MKSGLYQLTDEQHATVLAALRFYQQEGMGDPFKRDDDIHELATNGGNVFSSLDDEGIDALCESINHDGLDITQCLNVLTGDNDYQSDPFFLAARRIHHSDGRLEIHEPAFVSPSDNGAYVLAWAWVSNEAADVDDDEDACAACGADASSGDSWNGLCPDCADLVADDKAVTEWAKKRGIKFSEQSDDGQHDLRIEFCREQRGEVSA